MNPHEMLLAAGTGEGIGDNLAALFPPVAMAVVFVLICRAALRSTDWKKHEDDGGATEQTRAEKPPREPGN